MMGTAASSAPSPGEAPRLAGRTPLAAVGGVLFVNGLRRTPHHRARPHGKNLPKTKSPSRPSRGTGDGDRTPAWRDGRTRPPKLPRRRPLVARIIHEHVYCPPVALQRATGTRDSLLRPACMGLPLHAGGRARRSVGQRTDHPLHVSEQRVPGTPPSLAAPRARLATRLRDFETNRHE